MAKKKVVVRRTGQSHKISQHQKHHDFSTQQDAFDLFDDITEKTDDDFKQSYPRNSKAAKLARLEKQVQKMNQRQQTQEDLLTRIASICMNYASGIITVVIIIAICVAMLGYIPKIISNNPSFASATPIIIGGIMIIAVGLIFSEILRMRARRKERKEKRSLF